jgi:hypothetical protein
LTVATAEIKLQIKRHLKTSVIDFFLLLTIIFRQAHTVVLSSLKATAYKPLEKLLKILYGIRPQREMENFQHFGEHYIFHLQGDSS